ncbi:lipopolysaccharide biosynthesis protein [Beduini massiliensis]|uniref:lipopolysaccharide biosynthesis protein n=1 Tax=Beduini massiliensis TaxID=1585974 RepID=UPI00059A88FE|nr:oligosaccharide flippase family protein [Beduini massiliensis]
MMIKRWIIGSNENVDKKSVFWNMIASTLNAGLSVLFLLIVTRILGVVEAGIFSLAYSVSMMMLTIGLFDMRTYQATDVSEGSNFKYYFTSRVITCILMLIGSVFYVMVKGYTTYKIIIVLLLCLLKMFDAFEDVFQGLFQQNERLDIAGRLQALRLAAVIFVFFITLIIFKNLVFSITLSIITSLVIILFLLLPVASNFAKIELCWDKNQLLKIFMACFPLFLGSYLALYTENSPKYAIDQFLQPEFQTYFNILFMPSYVISLFSSFAFRPLITPMAKSWTDHYFNKFMGYIKKLVLYAVGFTTITLIGTYFLGIPVLSILYNTDLSAYKNILILLIIGGGVNTLGTCIYYAITIMRKQKILLIGYGISALCAYLITPIIVSRYNLLGGAIIFVILIFIRTTCFLFSFLFYYKKEKRRLLN